jgi:urea transport system permease protein
MDVMLVRQVLTGLSLISILALVAMGLAIIFGVMRIINMAHGEFFMLGAYVAYIVGRIGEGRLLSKGGHQLAEFSFVTFLLGIGVAFFAVAAIGLLLERLILRHLYNKPLETLLATWGLSILLQQLVVVIFGRELQYVVLPMTGSFTIFGAEYPTYRIFILFLTLGIVFVTYFLIYRTDFGLRLRAIVQNREMAEALGIDNSRVYMLTFAFGCGLAGVAGYIISPIKSVSPFMGLSYVVDAFMVVIFGGVGHLVGSIGGSAIIGGAKTVFAYFSSEMTAQILVFVVVILILRLRPEGVFTRPPR